MYNPITNNMERRVPKCLVHYMNNKYQKQTTEIKKRVHFQCNSVAIFSVDKYFYNFKNT